MSVINKVLKDLDQRQQPHGMDNITTAQMIYPTRRARWPWLLLTLVLVIGAGYLGYWLHGHAEASLASSKVAPSAALQTHDLAQAEVESTAPVAAVDTPKAQTVTASVATPTATEPKPTSASQAATEPIADAKQQQLTKLANKVITTTDSTASEVVTQAEPKPAQAKPVEAKRPEVVVAEPPAPSKAVISAAITPAAVAKPVTTSKAATGTMAVTEVKVSPQQLAQKRFNLAMDAKQNGDVNDAMLLLNQALTLDPSMHQARKQLAALFYGRRQYTQASEVLEQGLGLYPKQYEFVLLLARVQQAQGNDKAVLALLEQIPASSQYAMDKWALQSDIAQKLGQFKLAEQGYRQLAQHQPEQPRWWMGLAYALDSQADYSAAARAYKQALLYPGLSSTAEQFIKTRLQQLGE